MNYLRSCLDSLCTDATIHPWEDGLRKKIVLVGDGFTGKTSLQVAFRTDNFNAGRDDGFGIGNFEEEYRPTIFETYATTLSFLKDNGDIAMMELAIWDTAGQEDYDRLRPLSYPNTDIIMVCFSIDSPDSLTNVEDLWKPELDLFCPNVPIILVGKLGTTTIELKHGRCTSFLIFSRIQLPCLLCRN